MLQRVLFRWSLHQQDQCFTKKAKKKTNTWWIHNKSKSCMQQFVMVDVSMSDPISRQGYVVQMSMNYMCLYSLFYNTLPCLIVSERLKKKSNI